MDNKLGTTYILDLTTITNVYIGDGNVLSNTQKDIFKYLNKHNYTDSFIQYAKSYGSKNNDAITTFSLFNSHKELLNGYTNNYHSFVADINNRYFIPGSSLKGTIMNLLVSGINAKNNTNYDIKDNYIKNQIAPYISMPDIYINDNDMELNSHIPEMPGQEQTINGKYECIKQNINFKINVNVSKYFPNDLNFKDLIDLGSKYIKQQYQNWATEFIDMDNNKINKLSELNNNILFLGKAQSAPLKVIYKANWKNVVDKTLKEHTPKHCDLKRWCDLHKQIILGLCKFEIN